ncbi:MAG: hypothetical protein WHX52_00525 [Anaerolineae bacterium]
MKHFALVLTLIFLFCASGVALTQSGGGYDLTWWTVDNGGGALSGGGYALNGTIGQSEAGPALTGSGFVLYSGFWVAGGAAPSLCPDPITGGWIVGPDSGYTGINYEFTAGPNVTATLPLTYTWSSAGLVSGQGTANATYTWAVAGTHVLSVTIENCGGSVSITHTLTLVESPPGCAVPLTGVGLSGPASGQTGQDLTYTVSPQPTNATTPITYTWSTDGLVSGQGTTQAIYRWNSAGSKTVQVSGRNCGGQDRNASQTVSVTAACAIPLIGVTISGQNTGYTNVTYQFTALPDPNDATTPIGYVWSSDGLVSGQGTNQAGYRWTGVGAHTISLTATNCGGSFSDDHTITLTEQPANCAVPLTGVSISGPAQGDKNVDQTFTATIQPLNATTPITYIWSATGLVSGQGTQQAVYRWNQTGTYLVNLSVSNCGGSANANWTIEVGKTYIYLPLVLRNHH